MKKLIRFFLFALAPVYLLSCQKEEKMVTYPKSYPVYDQAEVAEATITYDDSISLSVNVSDQGTPLSTLEVQVVVNNELFSSESIRTKGNTAEIHRRYAIPFGPNRMENAPVKVYLSSINVDGWTTDTILNTTIVKRPEIENLWLVPEKGTTYKLTLIDSANYIWHVSGMNFGDSINYRLATKIDSKFKKVDFSGLVFGQVGDGIGIIDTAGKPIVSFDPTLVSINELTFDAMQLTVQIAGKLLEPVTTLDINADLSPTVIADKNFRSANVFFGEGVEVTFTGLTDLTKSLPPDWFEITGANTAKFLGKNAIYKADYYVDAEYLYVQPQPDVKYPDVMWITGTGFGHPSPPYEVTSSWNWNTPFDYLPARQVADGIYQITVYGKNTDNKAGFGTFDFKFFYQVGWGTLGVTEIDAAQYTITPPFFGRTDPNNLGNVNPGTAPLEGVFRFTLNQNDKTITVEKLN
jgi:hypothetical protein